MWNDCSQSSCNKNSSWPVYSARASRFRYETTNDVGSIPGVSAFSCGGGSGGGVTSVMIRGGSARCGWIAGGGGGGSSVGGGGALFSGTCPVSSPSASPYINLTNQVSGGHRIAVSSPRGQSSSLHAHLFCIIPQWRPWRERRGDSHTFRAFHRQCWWRRFPTRGATASNLMTLAIVTDTGRRAVVVVPRQAKCLALCFCHCSKHGGTVSPNNPENYCSHPYTDQFLPWVCEKQIKVQMDSLKSRTDYGLKLLQRLYLHSVKNTSTLTATLAHQTQQPRKSASSGSSPFYHPNHLEGLSKTIAFPQAGRRFPVRRK